VGRGSGRELPSVVGAFDGCYRRKPVIRHVVMAGSTESQSGRSEAALLVVISSEAAAPSYCVAGLSAGRVVRASELGLPRRGAEAHIVGVITEASRVQRILTHIGEPAESPPIAPALGGPCGTSDSVPFGTGMRWDNRSPSTCSTKRCTANPARRTAINHRAKGALSAEPARLCAHPVAWPTLPHRNRRNPLPPLGWAAIFDFTRVATS
jgi:hypothetical protein